MYTLSEVVGLLGLSTINQVRNRIEAIRDVLAPHLRRGPNNQLLLTEQGLSLLRDLQSLCETGHTMTEAANVIRFKYLQDGTSNTADNDKTVENREKQEGGWEALVEHLAGEVRDLASRVAAVEARLQRLERQPTWWEAWRS